MRAYPGPSVFAGKVLFAGSRPEGIHNLGRGERTREAGQTQVPCGSDGVDVRVG